jgi:hypothetical protein
MEDPFSSGTHFGYEINQLKRLEINLPPLLLMVDNNMKIHERLMVCIYEDMDLFYPDRDNVDLSDLSASNIKDESLRGLGEKLLPDIVKLCKYVERS